MSSPFNFKVNGVEQLLANLAKVGKAVEASAVGFVQETSKHVAERGKANAPILTGALRSQLQPTPANVTGDKVQGGVQDPVTYALEMHESLIPYGDNDLGTGRDLYRLGTLSAQQPGTEEGGVGGKYVTRVIQHHSMKYQADLEAATKKAIEGPFSAPS